MKKFIRQFKNYKYDHLFKVRALEKLYKVIDFHWAEVCESLPTIEALSEDESFPAADLAAAIASKFFFHLQVLIFYLLLILSKNKIFNGRRLRKTFRRS